MTAGGEPGAMNEDRRSFILANTAPIAPPHVPEIVLRLADEAHDLWHLTEEELQQRGLPPPFWAFAWAGGQGLALRLGRRELDMDPEHRAAAQQRQDLAHGRGGDRDAALGRFVARPRQMQEDR